jgi:magnesium transporter
MIEDQTQKNTIPHPEEMDVVHTHGDDDTPSLNVPNDEEESFYGLSDDAFDGIIAALHTEDWLTVEKEVLELEPADIAQLLEKSSKDDALELAKHLHGVIDSETYTYLGHQRLKNLFTVLSSREIGGIIADLDTDDAIALLEDVPQEERREILRHVNTMISSLVEEGLTYPEESAGRLMQRDAVAIPQFWTIGKTLDYLQAMRDELPEQLYDLFIVDPRHRVVGQVPIGQVLRASRGNKIADVARETVHVVPADTDQEEVAALFKRVTLTSVPVVDEGERLIGVITIDDIVAVVEQEANEDLLRLGGVAEDDLGQSTWATTISRFKWLFLNLLTALLASSVVARFEEALSQIVALAVLMPIVAGMGGNAGTQTLTVAVRALATKELSSANYWRVTLKETIVGTLNGAAFAVLMALITFAWFRDPYLAAVIAAAMIINLFAAGLAGALIPIGLNKIKIDPAISSAVFLTTVTDVVGFLSFLGLATIFLLK